MLQKDFSPALTRALGLCAVLLLGVLSCRHASPLDREQLASPVLVSIVTAHEETFPKLYRASGTVRGRDTATLSSRALGYVRAVTVRPGDHVQKGQVLVVLEANDSTAGVNRAQAGLNFALESLTEAEQALVSAKATLGLAKSRYERITKLFEQQAVSAQEMDEAKARFDEAKAQAAMNEAKVSATRARIEQARAETAEAQSKLDYAKILAPFAGQIIARHIDPGALASSASTLLVIEGEGPVRVETQVNEGQAAVLRLFDVVTVEFDGLATSQTNTSSHPRLVPGRIAEIVPSIDVASRAFVVKVDLPAGTQGLRTGMFARVNFRVGDEQRLVVPASSINSFGALDRVFAVDGARVRLRMVSLGERIDDWVEVLSGLVAGERVVSHPSKHLVDGALLREPQAEANPATAHNAATSAVK